MNFDATRYMDSVKHLDIPREDKEEMLRKLWNFLEYIMLNIDDLEQLAKKQTEVLEDERTGEGS